MSVVVSGDFCYFSRLHTPISIVVHAEVVCAPKILPIGIFLSHVLRSKIIALWDMSQYQNCPRILLETSVFYLNFPISLLSGNALNKQTGHGRGRNLGTRLIFTPPRVVQSINVQYLPHPHRDNSGGFSVRKPTPRGQRSKSECAALNSSFDRNNSDGKANLKRKKSPETTTDTQDASKCY